MKHIYHIMNKCILIILAVQVMNMSFSNLNNFFSGERGYDQSYNRIDCAFEYVTERLLGWDNFIPESRFASSHDAAHLHKCSNIFWYTEPSQPKENVQVHPQADYPLALSFLVQGYTADINPPPPKRHAA